MKSLSCCLLVFLFCAPLSLIAFDVPSAPVRNVTETLHGISVEDPFRYFEERGNPEVDEWARSQSSAAIEYLAALPGRDKLYERLLSLDSEFGAEVYSISYGTSGAAYFMKREAGESLARLYRQNLDGETELLLDPTTYGKESQPASVRHYSVSPDEQILAVGMDTGGSENASMYVIDLKTGERLGEPLPRARWGSANWLPDSSGFFFSQLQYIGPDGDRQQTFQNSRVHLYTVAERELEPVFGSGLHPDVAIAPEHLPFISVAPGVDWAFATVRTGVSAELDLYIAPVASVRDASVNWIQVAKMIDAVGSKRGNYAAVDGDSLLLLTRKNAPNGKIVRVNLHEPVMEEAELVFQAESGVIQSLEAAKDAIYVKVLEGGPSSIIRLPFDALHQPERIPLPQAGRVSLNSVRPTRNGAHLIHGSWDRPSQHYYYDPLKKELLNTELIPGKRPSICDELEVKVVHYKSHDGVEIPLSIVHRSDLQTDGNNPAYLVGYGAYGITIEPALWKSALPFLEQGGVLAIAHLRGGGAYGDAWRLAGYKATKPNTWKDFIAAGEYLIENGFTRSALLAASGRSAGGITVGRAITERPELFGGAIIGVGVSDTVRMETTPNGVPNIPEFGTVQNEDEFHWLLAMSSYHHVRDGIKYPPTLITHGANDTRVELWQSLKMAARLQAATASEAPILLRVDYGSGHGRGSSSDQRKNLNADIYAFVLNLGKMHP